MPADQGRRPSPPGWGSVARRGARVLWEDGARRPQPEPSRRPPRIPALEEWRDEGPLRPGPGREGRRSRRRADDHSATSGAEPALPPEVARELAEAAGGAQGAKLAERLEMAARAYARDRYADALRITKSLVAQVPRSASAQELHGLACYRLGRYGQAVRHLETARELAGGDPSQLPVLMDCHRAQGHHRRVEQLWTELREASPDAEVLAEGRLVMAAEMADEGDIDGATALLVEAGVGRNRRHPSPRHVRGWYVLADLAERAGDLARARELFARVAEADPELADASARLAAVGRPAAGRGRQRRR